MPLVGLHLPVVRLEHMRFINSTPDTIAQRPLITRVHLLLRNGTLKQQVGDITRFGVEDTTARVQMPLQAGGHGQVKRARS